MEILYTFFGWLLGLLSQPIVSRIERHYKCKDIKIAIFSELKNLLVRLAATYSKIQTHLGVQDKESLRWLKTIYLKYRVECPQNVLEAMDKVLQASDENFKTVANLLKAKENAALGLKTYLLPFTDSVLDSLSIFDPKFQRDILEIRAQVSILNEEIENAMFYFRLTFDPSALSVNRNTIEVNLNNSYKLIERQSKIVVDKIEKILEGN